jgi:proline dehydrogenase
MHRIVKYTTTEYHLDKIISTYKSKNIIPILDYAVEYNTDVDTFIKKKSELFDKYPNNYHAFKISSIDFCRSAFFKLMQHAKHRNCKILLDAEDYKVQNTVDEFYDVIVSLNYDFDIFKTYQMYRTDMMDNLLMDIEEFRRCNLIHNIKLVRGAYIMKDMNYGIIHKSKENTDTYYDRAVNELLKISKNNNKMKVIFATHNTNSYNLIKDVQRDNIFHASLMGLDTSFQNGSIKRMVHVPFGPYHKTYPYLYRRLCDNNKYLDTVVSMKQTLIH